MQVHAQLALTNPALQRIAALREQLDPSRTRRFPLHVTIAYAPTRPLDDITLPVESLTVRLSNVRRWPAPDRGIFLGVDDHFGWIVRLREQLGETASESPYVPHVTLVHHSAAPTGSALDILQQRFARLWTPADVAVERLVRFDEHGNALEYRTLHLPEITTRSSDITIRTAGADDAATLSGLGRTTFADTFGYLFARVPDELTAHLDHEFSLDVTRELLGRPEIHYVLAIADGAAVGYAKAIDEGGTAQLERIYVAQSHLGRRIGEPLLEAALACARSLRAQSLRLSVFQGNERAQRFYRKHGFATYGTESYAIGSQTFAFYLMRRDVSG